MYGDVCKLFSKFSCVNTKNTTKKMCIPNYCIYYCILTMTKGKPRQPQSFKVKVLILCTLLQFTVGLNEKIE